MMEKAQRIAREWMPGMRQGPDHRPAWKHPEDLTLLLVELLGGEPAPTAHDHGPPRYVNEGTDLRDLEHLQDASEFYLARDQWREVMAVAWLHDIIEDGVRENGKHVTADDLRAERIPEAVIEGVVWLSHQEGEPKHAYLTRVLDAPPKIRLVKLVDRICNLREGKESFKDARWARYVQETAEFITPLLVNLGEFAYLEPLLKGMLVSAVAGRPVVS